MVSRIDRARPGRSSLAPEGGAHVLAAGETFDSLAERFGVVDAGALEEFRRLNPSLASGRALPGQLVLLPADGPAAPARPPLETDWRQGFRRRVGGQNRYNAALERAVERWPELDPLVLKSMLAQESGFEPAARNRYGYAGIAQLGVAEARSQGLNTGASRMSNSARGVRARVDPRDERLVAEKAIPAAAGLMRDKAAALERGGTIRGVRCEGFATLGRPEGDDYWRFVAAAYNAGEGTILRALRHAYGDRPPAAVRWEDLVAAPGGDVRRSPLYRAIRDVGMNPAVKYREVSEYARDVLLRARQE